MERRRTRRSGEIVETCDVRAVVAVGGGWGGNIANKPGHQQNRPFRLPPGPTVSSAKPGTTRNGIMAEANGV